MNGFMTVSMILIGVILYSMFQFVYNQEPTSEALFILNERFARGDISKEDYIDKKRMLKKGK